MIAREKIETVILYNEATQTRLNRKWGVFSLKPKMLEIILEITEQFFMQLSVLRIVKH